MRVWTVFSIGVLFLTACSDGSDSATEQEGITAVQIDGVWVFHHEPDAFMDALHSGTPEIVDGCLFVDDTVVVWHAGGMGEAEAAVNAAKTGERPQLLIGGGGLSTEEGADPGLLPSVITDRCSTTAVWFGAP